MGRQAGPRIITDGLVAAIDPGNAKSQDSMPVQNRSNWPTNWNVKRSIVTDVTGTKVPPAELPADVSVYRLEIDLSTYANTLHRATDGASGYTMVDPSEMTYNTQFTMWVAGDPSNSSASSYVSIDIADTNVTSSPAMGQSPDWVKITTTNDQPIVRSYAWDFVDFFPVLTDSSDYLYVCGLTIVQSNTDTVANQQQLFTDFGYIPNFSTRGTTPFDIAYKDSWTITEAKWDPTNKYFQLDAASMYIKSDFATPVTLQGDPSITVMQVIRRTGTISAGASWGIGGNVVGSGINSYCPPSESNKPGLDLWGETTVVPSTYTYPLDEWVVVHWTKQSGDPSTGKCGIWINDASVDLTYNRYLQDDTITINSDGLVLGRAGANVDSYYIDNADIGPTFFYDRELSEAEIIRNARIYMTRFGIS